MRKLAVPTRIFAGRKTDLSSFVRKGLADYQEAMTAAGKFFAGQLQKMVDKMTERWMNNPCSGLVGPHTYKPGDPTTAPTPTKSRPESKPE